MPKRAIAPLRRCPRDTAVQTEQHWYRHAQAPSFSICSRCFHDHLAASPMSNEFEAERDDTGDPRYCDFNTPRTIRLVRESAQRNNWNQFGAYLVSRGQLPRCKGAAAVRPEETRVWYLIRPEYGTDIMVCPACYENYVITAGLADKFENQPVCQASDMLWQCDLGFSFTRKLLSRADTWDRKFSTICHRSQLPDCNGATATEATSGRWFQAQVHGLDSLWICETCHLDLVGKTPLQKLFAQAQPSVQSQLTCLAGGNVPLRVVLEEAVEVQDFNVFHHAAYTCVTNPPCSKDGIKDGIKDGVWYSLNPAAAEFDVCAACHAGLFTAMGIAHFLTQKHIAPGEIRLCNLNLATPRALTHFKRIDWSIEDRDLASFDLFVRSLSDTPLCPRREPVAGRNWYQHAIFSCCPSCWIETSMGTSALASCFYAQNQPVSTPLKCDFYSPRVRKLWREACKTNDLESFTSFMAQRLEVWKQTYPLIQQNLNLMRINASTQSTLFMSSVLLNEGNNIAAAAGANGNYGNGQIGYGYETSAGARGAVQFNQALGMTGSNAGPAAAIAQLESLWATVE